MSPFSVILLICIYEAGFHAVYGRQVCLPGTYLDQVTGHCDSCDDICQSADIQGTEDDCLKHCPDYDRGIQSTTPSQECPAGQYFDPVLSVCDFCSIICDDHEIQKTTESCKKNCPKEYNDSEEQKTIQESVVTQKDGEGQSNGVGIGITILGLAIVIAGTTGLIAIFHKQLPESIRQRIPCIRQGQHPANLPENNPLTASVSSSNESVPISIEETAEQELVFTDLRSGRLSSTPSNDT